jgi:two-component system response regulator AtoC
VVTKKATHELERQIILKVLKANNWNRQKTAKWLKISYRSLLYKLNEVSAEGAEGLQRATPRPKGPAGAGPSPASGLEPSRLIQ